MLKKIFLMIIFINLKVESVIDFNNIHDKQARFYQACHQGDMNLIKLLLCVNINGVHRTGYTPLMFAVKSNRKQAVNLLINFGADINVKGINSCTAIHLAVNNSNVEILKMLIAAGANINAKRNEGNTALHDAVQKNCLDIVKILIAAGADIEITNNQGKTAFDLAQENYTQEIIEIFKKHHQEQDAKKLIQVDGNEKSVVTVENSSNNKLNILQQTVIPAHSKAIITTEISTI
jgi:ankyrin repeat protein